MLQVEIVCNEHVIHPFRTMKFIWISEWLNRVSLKYLLSYFWEFASAFLSELREVHEIGNYSERMKCNVKILYWSTSFVKKPDEARKCG